MHHTAPILGATALDVVAASSVRRPKPGLVNFRLIIPTVVDVVTASTDIDLVAKGRLDCVYGVRPSTRIAQTLYGVDTFSRTFDCDKRITQIVIDGSSRVKRLRRMLIVAARDGEATRFPHSVPSKGLKPFTISTRHGRSACLLLAPPRASGLLDPHWKSLAGYQHGCCKYELKNTHHDRSAAGSSWMEWIDEGKVGTSRWRPTRLYRRLHRAQPGKNILTRQPRAFQAPGNRHAQRIRRLWRRNQVARSPL